MSLLMLRFSIWATGIAGAVVSLAPVPLQAAAGQSNGQVQLAKQQYMKNVDEEFAKADANGDKTLSTDELQVFRTRAFLARQKARNEQTFLRLDANKDGFISKTEFASVLPAAPKVNVSPLLQRIDSNKDGKLTLSEFRAGAASDFARLDRNSDGLINPGENSREAEKP